jgi:hypothetical protein
MESNIEYVTKDDLQAIINRVLSKYPWMADYPIVCHAKCSRWVIAELHGAEAGDAWHEYDTAVWMLTGGHAGKRASQ